MATFRIGHSVVWGQDSLIRSKEYTGTLVTLLDGEQVADAQTDVEIEVTLDFSAVKAFYLVSDQDVTLETNDGTTPDDTFALLAGVPYVWNTDSYDTFLVTVDVTSIFITNASGSAATLYLWALLDATP